MAERALTPQQIDELVEKRIISPERGKDLLTLYTSNPNSTSYADAYARERHGGYTDPARNDGSPGAYPAPPNALQRLVLRADEALSDKDNQAREDYAKTSQPFVSSAPPPPAPPKPGDVVAQGAPRPGSPEEAALLANPPPNAAPAPTPKAAPRVGGGPGAGSLWRSPQAMALDKLVQEEDADAVAKAEEELKARGESMLERGIVRQLATDDADARQKQIDADNEKYNKERDDLNAQWDKTLKERDAAKFSNLPALEQALLVVAAGLGGAAAGWAGFNPLLGWTLIEQSIQNKVRNLSDKMQLISGHMTSLGNSATEQSKRVLAAAQQSRQVYIDKLEILKDKSNDEDVRRNAEYNLKHLKRIQEGRPLQQELERMGKDEASRKAAAAAAAAYDDKLFRRAMEMEKVNTDRQNSAGARKDREEAAGLATAETLLDQAWETAVANTPGVVGSIYNGSVPEWAMTDSYKKYKNAANVIAAAVRKPGDSSDKDQDRLRENAPQPGDGPEVLREKRRNLQNLLYERFPTAAPQRPQIDARPNGARK